MAPSSPPFPLATQPAAAILLQSGPIPPQPRSGAVPPQPSPAPAPYSPNPSPVPVPSPSRPTIAATGNRRRVRNRPRGRQGVQFNSIASNQPEGIHRKGEVEQVLTQRWQSGLGTRASSSPARHQPRTEEGYRNTSTDQRWLFGLGVYVMGVGPKRIGKIKWQQRC